VYLIKVEEPLKNPVRLRLLQEGEAGLDAREPHLLNEVIAEVLAAVIHPQPKATGHMGGH